MIGKGENGETIIFMGEGDVLISTGRHPEQQYENEVIFSQDEPKEIGAYTEKHAGQPSTVLTNPVRLQFLRVESVDVLLERLHKVRAQMVGALGEPVKAAEGGGAARCDKCNLRAATHRDSGAGGWHLNYCDECDPPKAHGVASAYRDAEGWVLSGADGKPVNWPQGWPPVVDVRFLRAQGVRVAEG